MATLHDKQSATPRHTQIAEVLRNALALLGPNGEHWIKGCGAKDAEGAELNDDDYRENAVSWCISGAIIQAEIPANRHYERSPAWQFVRKILGNDLPNWNDAKSRSFAEVKALFEKAIKKAERL